MTPRRASWIVVAAATTLLAPTLVAAAPLLAPATSPRRPATPTLVAAAPLLAPATSPAGRPSSVHMTRSLVAPATTPPPVTDDARKAAARKLAEAASAAFAAGDYPAALARFEEAMALRPNPKLHYNLGVCHQRLTRQAAARGDADAEARHADAAIDAFNAYLRDNPDAPDRAAVELLIRDLGGTPITQPQLRDPLAPLPTAPPVQSPAPPANTTDPPGPIPRPYDPPAPA